MPNVNIIITIDSHSRNLEYCLLEARKLDPKTHFRFVKGVWVGYFDDFPIQRDRDLDILIVVSGNPGSNSTMNVIVDKMDKGNYDLFKLFNWNGYGQFNEEIRL